MLMQLGAPTARPHSPIHHGRVTLSVYVPVSVSANVHRAELSVNVNFNFNFAFENLCFQCRSFPLTKVNRAISPEEAKRWVDTMYLGHHAHHLVLALSRGLLFFCTFARVQQMI